MSQLESSNIERGNQRVLVIDDDQAIHRLVTPILRSLGAEPLNAYGGLEGLQMARDNDPSLILLDYCMPGCDGLEFLDDFRNDPNLNAIPILMITGSEDRKLVTLAFEKGVTDYVTKPIHLGALKARVRSILQKQSLLQDLRIRYEFDDLTGLLSKQRLVDQVASAIENEKERGSSFAVIFVDLDHFKMINDCLGHSIGDRVIQRVSKRLIGSIRKSDTIASTTREMKVARLSGDKFVILIDAIESRADLETIANRVLSQLQEPFQIAGRALHVNASLGIVESCGEYQRAGDVLRDADIAMYAAKEAGRGGFKFFDVDMGEIVRKRWRLDHDLRIAIQQDQFELLYQPIINLQTDEVESVEALIRWNHPERGLVSPVDFIPLAEETGLILEIGRWVAQEACRQYAQWQEQDPIATPEHVSVNLARQELLQPNYCEDIADILIKTGVDPQRVHFEVTESQIMDNLETALRTLEGLRGLGSKIDLDDFGTGHSSLACLNQLPIDVLKLDRSLVNSINQGGYFVDLASLVIKLLAGTRISIIAEGIETEEQLLALRQLGCQLGQGYFFARPLKATDVPEFVRQQRIKQSVRSQEQSKEVTLRDESHLNV
jgi:diguanylate cyclase (GGDEF)-like protein